MATRRHSPGGALRPAVPPPPALLGGDVRAFAFGNIPVTFSGKLAKFAPELKHLAPPPAPPPRGAVVEADNEASVGRRGTACRATSAPITAVLCLLRPPSCGPARGRRARSCVLASGRACLRSRPRPTPSPRVPSRSSCLRGAAPVLAEPSRGSSRAVTQLGEGSQLSDRRRLVVGEGEGRGVVVVEEPVLEAQPGRPVRVAPWPPVDQDGRAVERI